ncbi:MAG: ATP-binding protein [Solirubrobacteraceae bacterium]
MLLAGREEELERFSVLLDRLARGRPAEAILFAGSRGMGKTVLLRECNRRARAAGWFTSFEEVDPQLALRDVIALNARDVLYEMRASKRYGDRIKRALGVLRAFTSIGVLGVKLTIDSELLPGTADTGIFKRDLLALCRELGEIAATDQSGVVFFLDELHTLVGTEEMAVFDSVIHGLAQEGLPVTVVGAGIFPGPAFRDRRDALSPSTYAGRLYRVMRLLPLSRDAAAAALTQPAGELNVSFDDEGLREAVSFTGGVPWFIQLVGEEAWGAGSDGFISGEAIRLAMTRVRRRLYEEFYPRILRSLTAEDEAIIKSIVSLGGEDVDGYEAVMTAKEATDLDGHNLTIALKELMQRDILHLSNIVDFNRRMYSFTFPGTAAYVSDTLI